MTQNSREQFPADHEACAAGCKPKSQNAIPRLRFGLPVLEKRNLKKRQLGILCHSFPRLRFGLRWVIKWQILPKSCPDAWFRQATVMLCPNGRIDTFDSSNLIRKIETFSQVSGNDRSIPRKTPEFWRAVFGFASRRSAAAGPQVRI